MLYPTKQQNDSVPQQLKMTLFHKNHEMTLFHLAKMTLFHYTKMALFNNNKKMTLFHKNEKWLCSISIKKGLYSTMQK